MKPRALVVGGSIAGLTAGLLLTDLGFDVSVYERSASQLAERGAGIVAHEMSLRYLTACLGAELDEVSISSRLLRYLDAAGMCSHAEPSGYRFTSWHALHGRLAVTGKASLARRLGIRMVTEQVFLYMIDHMRAAHQVPAVHTDM